VTGFGQAEKSKDDKLKATIRHRLKSITSPTIDILPSIFQINISSFVSMKKYQFRIVTLSTNLNTAKSTCISTGKVKRVIKSTSTTYANLTTTNSILIVSLRNELLIIFKEIWPR